MQDAMVRQTFSRICDGGIKTNMKFESIAGAADILNKKIDGLGADMQWMKQALIEWTQAIQQDEQTNALIEKYCKDDQKKAHVWHLSPLFWFSNPIEILFDFEGT